MDSKRKPIGCAIYNGTYLTVVCDDGSTWFLDLRYRPSDFCHHSEIIGAWERLVPVPDTVAATHP